MLGRRYLWLIALMIPMLGWSQLPDHFHTLLKSAPNQQPELATAKMNQFISELQVKKAKSKSDEAFLRYAFREVQQRFLANYMAYSQFPEIFESGNYDCLSATSLFSVVLDALGFEYQIIETNYHIFMLAKADHKQVLLESTDKAHGFISDESKIQERLKIYQENKMMTASSADKYYYQYDLDLYQQVMPQQLTGLLFFNQAVSAFNNYDLPGCAQKLKKAIRIYNSPRVTEFAVILVAKIADSELSDEEKKQLISPFASLIRAKAGIVASL